MPRARHPDALDGNHGYQSKIRDEVRALYVHSHLNIPQISDRLNLPIRTIHRYRAKARTEGDDWENARLSALIAGQGYQATVSQVLEGLLQQSRSVIEAIKANESLDSEKKMSMLAQLAYSMNMARKAAEGLNPKISKLTVALEVLNLLTRYIRDEHPEHAAAFLDILQPFGTELRRRYA